METIRTAPIDKSKWGPGPWQDEPDRLQWQRAGYACLMVRHPVGGNWCGYVGVDKKHPYYGKLGSGPNSLNTHIEVHGGVNYAARCDGNICHVPEPGMPEDVWWLGFDCAHIDDLKPGEVAMFSEENLRLKLFDYQTYRDLPYVKKEVDNLADSLRLLRDVIHGRSEKAR